MGSEMCIRDRFCNQCESILEKISSVDGINYNLLQDIDPDNEFRDLINELADPSLDRAFAVDSHAPGKWAETESTIYLIEQANQNLLNNHRLSLDGSKNELRFIYSGLLYDACQNAKTNAQKQGLTKPLLLEHGLPPKIKRAPTKKPDLQPTESTNDNSSDALTSGVTGENSAVTLEMARILLWKPEDLLSDIGREMIASHAGYKIPLFYLAPELIDVKFLLDFFLICATGDQPDNFKGKLWERLTTRSQPINRLYNNHKINAFEVVVNLLKQPKLLYAADARQMMENNVYANFTSAQ